MMNDFAVMRDEAQKIQVKIIQDIKRNVTVAAGAGSGKTRVLVERFVYILQQAKEKQLAVAADNILAITFTRKAAAEMKSRVRKRMAEILAQEPQDYFWQEQMKSLERAQITTIHGLCSRILRENPVEAQLDPAFVVADDFAASDYIAQCVQSFIRGSLEQQELRLLLGVYGVNSFVNQLQALLPNLADIVEEKDLTAPYKESAASIASLLDKLLLVVQELADKREQLTKPKSKGREHLDNLTEHLAEVSAGLKAEKTDFAAYDSYVAVIKNQRGELKAVLDDAKKLRQQLEEAAYDKQALPLVAAWQKVLGELYSHIQKKKQDNDLLTYDDLELRALQLLKENAQVRQKYHERFRYIMVDEFQDTNERQRQLIYLLCGDSAMQLSGNKLFIVGDPKQSIYRFRGADVSVFAQVGAEIAQGGGGSYSMSHNFRSVDKILTACNRTFLPLLGEDRSQSVFFEALTPNSAGDFTPQLLKVMYNEDTKAQRRQLEAAAVAQKLRQLQAAGLPYGEMAILLRAMTHCETLTAELERQGVPYNVIDGKGFYARQEVLDLLNLLTVLHNRYRSLELAGVLRSPYFGLTDETITSLFLRGGSLWEALQQADLPGEQGALAARAAHCLQQLRAYAALAALPELWPELWRVLSVDVVLSRQENGAGKLANAQKLRQLAEAYSAEHQGCLGDWLAYVERVRKAEIRETAANVESEDAVQILTIHKSKGLEFNTVFIPFLDSPRNSSTAEIAYLPGLGLGIKLLLSNGQLVTSGVLHRLRDADKALDLAERLRQLYVGMTRAEKALLLSGAVQSGKEPKQDKPLAELDWMSQMLLIFAEGEDMEVQELDLGDELPPAAERSTARLEVTPEVQQAIAPLPAYAASGRRHFTASGLQTYLYCQRQYFYQQVLQLPELEEESAGESSQSALPAKLTGLIVHRALELYRGNADAAFKRAVSELAPGEQVDFAQQLFVSYIESDLYKKIPAEQQRELKFSWPAPQGLVIDGVIDCLAKQADGSLYVVDYKTGTPPENISRGYSYQLALYKKAAQQLTGLPVSGAQLHFLQNLSTWDLSEDEDYMAEALALCTEIAAKNEEAQFSCASAEACKHCPYVYLCTRK